VATDDDAVSGQEGTGQGGAADGTPLTLTSPASWSRLSPASAGRVRGQICAQMRRRSSMP
jgi:hypothetical protein